MITVSITESDNLEKALRKFKKKYDKTGVVKQVRARQAYIKPCITRRQELIKARYKEKLRRNELEG